MSAGARIPVNGKEMTVAAMVYGHVPLGGALLCPSDVDGPVAGALANAGCCLPVVRRG